MQKKVGDIVQAFQNYRFEDSLRQIQQLMKKAAKDNKKKNNLSQNDQRIIQIIKCGCLASTARLHEANQIIQNYFTEKVIQQLPVQQIFLFCSIAQLAYDSKLLEKINLLTEIKGGKGDLRLQRFLLSRKMFSFVSKSFLKQYVMGKRPQDGLAQIFLQYLNEFNKKNSIQKEYKQDFSIVQHSELNLKMVQMFFTKYLSGIKMEQIKNQKLKSSILDLRIRLAINGKNIQEAKNIYNENSHLILRPQLRFVYLRSIRDFSESEHRNIGFYLQQCGKIFRQNMQIEKYIPMYDYYDELLQFLISKPGLNDLKELKQLLLSEKTSIMPNQLYHFKSVHAPISVYFRSLLYEYHHLTQGQNKQKYKKSDYYKISIKGLLLQMLKIYSKVFEKDEEKLTNNLLFAILIQAYKQFFGKTLTYLNQMQNYIKFLSMSFSNDIVTYMQCKLPKQFERPDDKLIYLINQVKIIAITQKSNLLEKEGFEQVKKWVNLLWKQYRHFIVSVQQDKRRQKGQVFISDEFIVLLFDIVIFYVQNNKVAQSDEAHNILTQLMAIMDYATQKSPYNAYLKLRLIYVAQKLNYFDKLIDIYLSMDIKSVQFQTLGYYLLNPLINFNLFSQYQGILTRMVRSYQDNQRQTSEYCLKGLKAGATNQVLEYFSYQKKLQKSFSKLMLFYTLFLKYNGQSNGENMFYLDWIDQKLRQYEEKKEKISFNCDTKTMLNTLIIGQESKIFKQNQNNEFYGIFTNFNIFKLEINVRKMQNLAKLIILKQNKEDIVNFTSLLKIVEDQICKIRKFSPKQMFNFEEQYEFIDQYLGKVRVDNKNNSQYVSMTQNKLMKQFEVYCLIVQSKIQAFRLFLQFIECFGQVQKVQNIEKNFEQLKNMTLQKVGENFKYFEGKLSWYEQTKLAWTLRQSIISLNHIFISLLQQFNKHKKLPKTYKTSLQNFNVNLEQMALTKCSQLKFKQCPMISKTRIFDSLQGLQQKYYQKNQERNQILDRFVRMDKKEVKKLLLKK